MPVSLSEWRVRIGTFVNWIREYEVKEKRERLLTERIRRLKVLCERLEAKMGDSGEESEDDKSRQDDPDPKGCPHKTSNIRSSGNTSDIKDLLTSCDQCIHELLTASDSHIKEILTPSDACIKQLLTPRRERLQRIQRLKVLCERLEAKMGDCGEGSEDDKSKQNGPDPKGCPHKTFKIRSSENSSDIKDLLTSCDQCIQELLPESDSHIKEILTPSDACIKRLLTPTDSNIRHLLSLTNACRKDQHTACDSHVEDLSMLTPNYSNIRELVINSDSCFRELHMSADACKDDMFFDPDVKDLLTPSDSIIIKILQPKDYCTNKLLTPRDSHTQELLTSSDTYIRELLSVHFHIQENFTPRDSYTSESLTTGDSYTNASLTLGDPYIQKLLTPRDSHTNELLTPTYAYANEPLTPGDIYYSNTSLTPGDSYIRDLLTPTDSYANESLTPGDSYTQDLLTPRDSNIRDLLTPTDSNANELLTPGDSYIHELLAPRYSYYNESLTPGDSYTQDLLTPRDSDIRTLLTPRDVYTNLSIAPGDSYIQELLTPGDSYTNEPPRPGNSFTNKSLTGVELVSPRQGDKQISPTSSLDCDAVQHGPSGGKEMASTSPRSSCHKTDSLKGTVDVMLSQQPYLTELLLVKAGDVELNPGPLHGSIDSVLQESELILLAEEVPVDYYNKLCTGLGFSLTQSQTVLTQHHFNFPGALINLFCRWKVKQRDGANIRALLGETLKNADMGALRTKLLEGEYLPSGTSPSGAVDRQEPPQPVVDMSEDEVTQCGEDLKNFYREHMCKIKTEPFHFQSFREFEQIYTNLVLQRRGMTKTKLDYSALLTTTINGVLPKRLLIEGEGGVGKSTFCSKIAWDWIKGSPEFQRFSWVLVIPLRKVVKGQTIGDIMKDYLSDNNSVSPKQIDNYISSQPSKVMIVLDGLDEYDGDLSAKENSAISQILQMEKFKKCIVLVTTRPWRADTIKSNEGLSRSYAFIAVEGFSAVNISTYISKYFVNDEKAGSDLIRFIEVNDVIKENMAPFPIYVTMLCILWENCDSEKQEEIRKLKTFSQLFDQMIMFLGDHYVSKVTKVLHEAHLDKEMENVKLCLQRIGSIAFSGLLKKKLVFNEEDFNTCTEAMETCCKIGVLSRENRNVSRWKRTLSASQSVTTSVFFPHKLFQEYIASVYLASLYDTNREEYNRSMGKVLSMKPQEFRYLLYFTAALGREVGLDIVKKIQQKDFPNVRQRRRNNDFLADVTFEAYNKDTAKVVGQQIFADEKKLTFDKNKPAHTVSGYLFIMEQHGMETLVFRDRSCGPTVSRDLADALIASSSLSRLVFYRTTLDTDFYQLMHKHVSTMAGDKSSIIELVADHQFLNGLQTFNNGDINVTIGDLFPSLTQLAFTTDLHTVSPGDVERLAHSSLAVLSIERGKKRNNPVPLIGEPSSLGQLFSSSFPQLACLTFRGLVMGNIRSEAILRNLKNHLHLKSISIISCFTDNELNSLEKEITTENRMKIELQHKETQRTLSFDISTGPLIDVIDALCHRTCVHQLELKGLRESVKIASEDCFPDLHGREVNSKIQKFEVEKLQLRDDQSASYCLGKFLCLLSHLTDLKIYQCSFHEDFYKEIADRAASYQIHKFDITSLKLHDQQSESCYLGKFLSLLPHLLDLVIHSCSFHDDFYKEIADRAASSQIYRLKITYLNVRDNQSASCLGKFLNHLSHLADLQIDSSTLHDDFYKEIADRASSSQIETLSIKGLKLHDQQSASCCLGKFLSLLSHLTDLKIGSCTLHDDFYKEIAGRASSCQIHKLDIASLKLKNQQSESCCLGKFLCLLPHLTHLEIHYCFLHDDFYKEIADRAASSQIQTVDLQIISVDYIPSNSASKQLANFLCSLPCLTNLAITRDGYLHDDFFTELDSLAASSQSPYFRERKHIRMLQGWSARKHQRLQPQQWESARKRQQQQERESARKRQQQQERESARKRQQQQRESARKRQQQRFRPVPSTHQQSNLLHYVHPLESAHPSRQFHSYPHRGFPSEGIHHSLHPSSGEPSRHLIGQGSGYSSGVHAVSDLTSFHISSRTSNHDMPSTSGSRTTKCGKAPVEGERFPEHRKRIHSDEAKDDGDRVDERLEQRPGKRRAKTDRKPTSSYNP